MPLWNVQIYCDQVDGLFYIQCIDNTRVFCIMDFLPERKVTVSGELYQIKRDNVFIMEGLSWTELIGQPKWDFPLQCPMWISLH